MVRKRGRTDGDDEQAKGQLQKRDKHCRVEKLFV
jgi:hypothetical protein